MPILIPIKHTWIEYRGEFGEGKMLGSKGFIIVGIEELGVAAGIGYLDSLELGDQNWVSGERWNQSEHSVCNKTLEGE